MTLINLTRILPPLVSSIDEGIKINCPGLVTLDGHLKVLAPLANNQAIPKYELSVCSDYEMLY